MSQTTQSKPVVENKPAQPVMKGSREIRHDLFKLLPAKMEKNNGWKHKQPIIVEHEHSHIFHSRNEKTGKANKSCNPIGGHFHHVTVNWNKTVKKRFLKDGVWEEKDQPEVICGPAMTLHRSQGPDGIEYTEERPPTIAVDARMPQYKHLANEGQGENAARVDRHTHDVEYIETEFFTMGERNEFRKMQYQQVRSAMEGPVSPQVVAATALAQGAATGKNIADGKGTPSAGDGASAGNAQ